MCPQHNDDDATLYHFLTTVFFFSQFFFFSSRATLYAGHTHADMPSPPRRAKIDIKIYKTKERTNERVRAKVPNFQCFFFFDKISHAKYLAGSYHRIINVRERTHTCNHHFAPNTAMRLVGMVTRARARTRKKDNGIGQ